MRALIPLAAAVLGAALPATAQVPAEARAYRAELTRNARAVWGIDAPVSSFAAQIHQESRWRTDAVSVVGAQGMAQFMPSTVDWIAGAYPAELGDARPFNPSWSIRALVRYDRHLWDRITATGTCDRMAMTLSAYNGGLGWVYRDQRATAAAGADRRLWFGHVERFNAGRHAAAFRENRGYPRAILRTFEPRYIQAGFGSGACT
ncbi:MULTISPECIES: transglycosylase SLT domain-containing protein [Burkholderia cepacia complex]|uniref:transglycosylase SLT domain-containing protein n=1 Tax=Burkholderia cepacia complex TaxID=87882 RepID=UPI000BA58957|nr:MULTISPECIES: transglycosylase SLT domain-containing protein [Burkholderia cepacia complex]PAK13983.1 lytic transglycosylase [Burkholderia ubonensis]RQQ00160.1 lytic transglycosylase domain-containing protein [Burkholderia ubonensis]RQQ49143.1 lytic transglycosylase domain-containing protein [Burkholderia stagnalis]RQY00047.1 lytic transglycosylase domain-containing protein [Burkholderia stagnalis]RQY14522.1 lytic transglycosylase domain-containing protein [Burkholderia stagnalis]